MFQVLLLFVTVAYGLRTKLHMTLQAEPDANCQQWLASPAGQQYLDCDTGNPGLPVPYNQTNDCELIYEDFEVYCNNTCYEVMVKAWEFFLNTSTCLNVEEAKYKPCLNDSECPILGDGRPRVCYEGFCYNACNSTSDCNPCMAETCEMFGGSQMGNTNTTQGGNATQSPTTQAPRGNNSTNGTSSRGCRSANIRFANGSALVNRTLQNTFRAQLYKLKAGCSKSENNVYCGLMDLKNQTCDSLKSQWGCCASTYLPSIQYCEWISYPNATFNNLLTNCSWDISPCGGLDWAWNFCAFNMTQNSTNNASSSSSSGIIGTNSSSSSGFSSSSSGIIGSNSSSSSNFTGTNSTSSSSGISSSSGSGLFNPNASNIFSSSGSSSYSGSGSFLSSLTGGVGTNHTGNNTASAKATLSWTMTIALVLAAANVIS